MARIDWDDPQNRRFEGGVSKGVLFVATSTGGYGNGIVWNGLKSVKLAASGAEINRAYADNFNYSSFRSTENLEGSIESYTIPQEFKQCVGKNEVIPGVMLGRQSSKSFCFSCRTEIHSSKTGAVGYRIHLIYGASTKPTEKSRTTINDSPEAVLSSYDFKTVPMRVSGHKPTSYLAINVFQYNERVAQLEGILYGSDYADSSIPDPEEVFLLFGMDLTQQFSINENGELIYEYSEDIAIDFDIVGDDLVSTGEYLVNEHVTPIPVSYHINQNGELVMDD